MMEETLYGWRKRLLGVVLWFVLSLLIGVGSAAAQVEDDSWDFSGAVYLWGAGLGGETRSGSEIDVSFDDLVDNLEAGFMVAFEARRDRWSMFTDILYLDIGVERSAQASIPMPGGPVSVTGTADLDFTGWVLHFAGGYTVLEEERLLLDVIGGARYLDLDMDLALGFSLGGQDETRELSQGGSVWDGIVGVKGNVALGERWFLPYYADIGTGDSDFTWQASGGVGFSAASWVDLVLAYRHLAWELDSDRAIADLSFGGPGAAVIFRF
jgi:hypothetical protein